MLSLALILIALEGICHAILALLHLPPLRRLLERLGLPTPSHEARETLVGLLYAVLTGVLLLGAVAVAHSP